MNNFRKPYPEQNNYRRDGFGQKTDTWARRGNGDVRGNGSAFQGNRDNKRKG